MKWSIFGLVLLGVVAAFCATLLMASLRAQPANAYNAEGPTSVQIVVAAEDLRPMTVIREEHLETREVPTEEAPHKAISESVTAVGRMLAVPVVKSQPVTHNLLVPEGSGPSVAGLLPAGGRAMSVMMTDHTGIRDLLYPGSTVDILASFRLPGGENTAGQALSTTLLQNIQVLAVDDHVVSGEPRTAEEAEEVSENARAKPVRETNKFLATVLVNTRQAEALQLAMEYGTISFALRNPTDTTSSDDDATLLSGGQLAQMADFLQASVKEPKNLTNAEGGLSDVSSIQAFADPTYAPSVPAGAQFRDWMINIIRGTELAEQRSVQVPDGSPAMDRAAGAAQ